MSSALFAMVCVTNLLLKIQCCLNLLCLSINVLYLRQDIKQNHVLMFIGRYGNEVIIEEK